MNGDEPVRSSQARAAAELALVRVVHHYGEKPGFVLLGGLVPQLLCSQSAFRHAGTTDVDVQVDLEIAAGATHTRRLERALANAEFRPDSERVWRWELQTDTGRKAQVKFELLADLEDQQQGAIITFNDCQQLGAVNLRGTGYAARDVQEHTLRAKDGGILREVQVNVSGLGGFLMAQSTVDERTTEPPARMSARGPGHDLRRCASWPLRRNSDSSSPASSSRSGRRSRYPDGLRVPIRASRLFRLTFRTSAE